MTFILWLVIITNNGPAVSSAAYDTEKSCEQARSELLVKFDNIRSAPYAVCTRF